MDALTFLIALLALALSLAAFRRTGGMSQLHEQAGEARRMAADALARAEDVVRPHTHDADVRRPRDGKGQE
jgi:hypothetical protein